MQTNLDLHQGRETTAEEKERELLQCIKDLKDLELVYNHEAEDAHKKLAQKGAEFQVRKGVGVEFCALVF